MSAENGDGKWLEGLSPEMSVGKAARLALDQRLAAVRDALGPATHLTADAEPVHQLRVATRRAVAAIKVFSPRLPKRVERRARSALRRLRRSAATARELDVFLTALEEWSPGRVKVEKPGLQFLVGHVIGERRAAQGAVRDAVHDCESRWAFRLERCARSARRGGGALGEFAAPLLSALTHNLDESVINVDVDNASPLHALRIAGKRLRYAFELLAQAVAPAARDSLYPVLSDMQEILGAANDNWQAIARLDKLIDAVTALRPHLLPSIRAGISAFRSAQREQFALQKAAFSAWRTKWRGVRTIEFRI